MCLMGKPRTFKPTNILATTVDITCMIGGYRGGGAVADQGGGARGARAPPGFALETPVSPISPPEIRVKIPVFR